jgi:hypothetical protein
MENQNENQPIKSVKPTQRICKYCHQTYELKPGLSNWKNLFKAPTLEDWITLFILIMLIAAAFAYTTETKVCKDTLNNLDEICLKRVNSINYTGNGVPDVILPINITNSFNNISNVS